MPTGVSKFHQAVAEKLESKQDTLTALGRELCGKLVEAGVAGEEPIASDQQTLEGLANTHPACQRLMTIPGGCSSVEGGTGRRWRWRTRRPGSCGPC